MDKNKTLADVQPGGRVRRGDQAERARFEEWYVQNAFDYEANPIGSRDCALMRKAWNAALSAQPSPGGQDVLDCIGRIEEAIEFRVPHDIYAAVHGELAELKAALAARQPVGEPVWVEIRRQGDRTFPRVMKRDHAEAFLRTCNVGPLPTIHPLYAAPPAQAVGLGQFRELLTTLVDRCGDDLSPDQFMLAGRLLNLIDSQA